MLPRRTVLCALAFAPAAAPLRAQATQGPPEPPPEVQAELPAARWRGSATMRWFGLSLYELRLWSAASAAAADLPTQALALELQYTRALVGRQIAERSISEMRRIGPFDEAQATRWLAALTRLFPDVQAGDRLTGVQRPGAATRFFHNGQARGEVAEPAFGPLFFGIWLSPRSSEPGLRQQLLGST
ncbi:chalcone isomerase family protein [Aquabacterium sp. OR-4]|uniref:chalcone isomerase family protein n=1 Tax=Aquabacterium sp. OR-4 TaxID=2978127 RepID=UPI0021B40CB5|nr:chalcone isomerase family protein [Aquabacterium sp. OR-4]MDT7834044.1 chalcone isomerase family protein [Aquabacterium sp. OR-4]